MFEYAAAWVQARRLEAPLRIDLEEFRSPRMWRHYQLWRWPAIGLRGAVLPALRRSGSPAREFEDGLGYNAAIHAVEDGTLLRGFFQSEKYFGALAADIRRMFDAAPFLLDADKRILEGGRTLVSLHVRRTDYLTIPLLDIGDLGAYYRTCMEDIAQHAGKPLFLVFSDDPHWCRQWPLLKQFDSIVVSERRRRSNFNDLALMASCAHHIIPNSTFGWWGAWLGRNAGKRVYIPAQWFDKHSTEEAGLLAKDWIAVPV